MRPVWGTRIPRGSRTNRKLGESAAVAAAGPRLAQPYEAWIAAEPSRGRVRVLITGPHGFERTVAFARDEAPKRTLIPPRAERTSSRPRAG
jgi:hypothetical protein